MQSILVMGDGALATGVVESLERAGSTVRRLRRWNDRELKRELHDPGTEAVVVVARDDIAVLRTALLVEYLRPGVRLIVTIFDRTVARQVLHTIPNCEVLSMADAAVGSILGPCVDERLVTLYREHEELVAVEAGEDGGPRLLDLDHKLPARPHRFRRWLGEQLRPYDHVSRVMLLSLIGLIVVIGLEALIVSLQSHENFGEALYGATKVTATVGPNSVVDHGPLWLKLYATATIAAAIILVAVFTATVVHRFMNPRLTGIFGRRTVPRSGHVVVVGLGQVGFRLCLELRALGIPVVAVERDADGPFVRLAAQRKIPVVIGSGVDRYVLERLSLSRARALAAVTSEELINVTVSVTALAVEPTLRTVLRSGSNEVTRETQALFPIGVAKDLVRVAATALAAAALQQDHVHAFSIEDRTWILSDGSGLARFP
jgi:voltage-gated potassium channel Kch